MHHAWGEWFKLRALEFIRIILHCRDTAMANNNISRFILRHDCVCLPYEISFFERILGIILIDIAYIQPWSLQFLFAPLLVLPRLNQMKRCRALRNFLCHRAIRSLQVIWNAGFKKYMLCLCMAQLTAICSPMEWRKSIAFVKVRCTQSMQQQQFDNVKSSLISGPVHGRVTTVAFTDGHIHIISMIRQKVWDNFHWAVEGGPHEARLTTHGTSFVQNGGGFHQILLDIFDIVLLTCFVELYMLSSHNRHGSYPCGSNHHLADTIHHVHVWRAVCSSHVRRWLRFGERKWPSWLDKSRRNWSWIWPIREFPRSSSARSLGWWFVKTKKLVVIIWSEQSTEPAVAG